MVRIDQKDVEKAAMSYFWYISRFD